MLRNYQRAALKGPGHASRARAAAAGSVCSAGKVLCSFEASFIQLHNTQEQFSSYSILDSSEVKKQTRSCAQINHSANAASKAGSARRIPGY